MFSDTNHCRTHWQDHVTRSPPSQFVQNVEVRMEPQHPIASHHALRDIFMLYTTQCTTH
jgi:hypothetical protein